MHAIVRLLTLLAAPLLAPFAATHQRDTANDAEFAVVRTTAPATAATVSGIVYDSIARAPLAGATVQLVASSGDGYGQSVVSDAAGAFSFSNVPDGRYNLGFFHPLLDSLGLEPLLRSVAVNGGVRAVRTDLAIPSAERLRATICGAQSVANAPAVVIGFVRNAADLSPASGAGVRGEWAEYSIGRGGIARQNPRRDVTTGANGWFAICGVPSPGTVLLVAGRGADSTDAIEAEVPANGFLRRDLYVGSARTVAARDANVRDANVRDANVRDVNTRDSLARDSAARGDSAAPAPRRVNLGSGRLSGTVFTSAGSRPLAGAQVGIVNGPQTRANETGEWTIANAPTGTRTLEVRAVGHYPIRRPVDVVSGTPPLHVSLVTLKSVLDTMKVTAAVLARNGFQERSRTGMGRFLSEADIARRAPNVTSDLFRSIPGVYLEMVMDADTASAFSGTTGASNDALSGNAGMKFVMRGTFSERCVPAIFVNGHNMPNLTAMEVDDLMRPREVGGIEIYSPTQVPAQFKPGLTGCGAIVFWTKVRD